MTEFALTPEQLAELQEASSKVKRLKTQSKIQPKRASSPKAFVQLPYERTLALVGQLGDAPSAVMIELAHLAFKTHQDTVLLANAKLRSVGVSRQAKLRALRQLETAGVVAVDWGGRGRSPLVTPLWLVQHR